jgi:hypothetical protein
VRCPSCGSESAEGAKFCAPRSARLKLSCPGGGAPADSGHRFCPACGASLQPPAPDAPQTTATASEGAEALLAAGSVSHNFLWFYHEAIETALNTGEWAAAERYAAALESYTRPEPLPWADFHVARGRAPAGVGRGARDDATIAELRRLRDAAERDGLQLMLPALRAALAEAAAMAPVPVGSV